MTEKDLWTDDNVLVGKLLLAVAEIQSFVHNNWTSAQARHQTLPSSGMHFFKAQLRHSSMLVVHARPVPEEDGDIDVDIFMRRKKLSEAWDMMKSVDRDLWINVCQLYSMVVAVEMKSEKFKENQSILNQDDDIVEAKILLRNAQILSAVETIESFRHEEWSNVHTSTAIRHGSELSIHIQHHDESVLETKVRHAEHAKAWQVMHSCDKADWTAACLYHELGMKSLTQKKEMLDVAVWV